MVLIVNTHTNFDIELLKDWLTIFFLLWLSGRTEKTWYTIQRPENIYEGIMGNSNLKSLYTVHYKKWRSRSHNTINTSSQRMWDYTFDFTRNRVHVQIKTIILPFSFHVWLFLFFLFFWYIEPFLMPKRKKNS